MAAKILATMDEITEHTSPLNGYAPVWVEYRTGIGYWALVSHFDYTDADRDRVHLFNIYQTPTKYFDGDPHMYMPDTTIAMKYYLKAWRCWTERPTPEQMTAEPWAD